MKKQLKELFEFGCKLINQSIEETPEISFNGITEKDNHKILIAIEKEYWDGGNIKKYPIEDKNGANYRYIVTEYSDAFKSEEEAIEKTMKILKTAYS